ncbi:MAG TPA: nodulation protein NfeD [Terriglobales bacterium]|jgi:membrane-bound serine protease (ClpP class)|nr:nodulation protein NfeD [Terriglobales bacterium]
MKRALSPELSALSSRVSVLGSRSSVSSFRFSFLSKRLASRFCLAALTSLFLVASCSADVLKIIVDDAIQPVTTEYIQRALETAHREKDQAVLIEMNTPGGLVESTREIIDKIVASPVSVIVYVTPAGSRAGSAGIFILEAADVAAMAPGTNAGAAHPVTLYGKPDDTMIKKIENDAAALMRSVATRRGRNVELAESAVRESKSFTDQEALDKKLIDYVAPTEQDLFRQMSGKSFKRFDGTAVTLDLAGQPIRDYEMTLKERILSYIMDPNITLIILMIGALCLYVEFNHPGAVVPGTIGVIFIVLAAFAMHLLPIRYAALAMIFVAFLLFAAEAKFASHGVLTAGGIVLLTLGGLLLVDGPIPEMRVRFLTAVAVAVPLGIITAFLMGIAVRARRNKIVTGEEGLIGEIGTAETLLAPAGKVFVHGELWDAISTAPIPAGEQVVVSQVDGLTLRVEPVTSAKPVMA